MYNVSFSRFVGTLDGSIHFSSDIQVGEDDEIGDGAHPRDKPVRPDLEGVAMTNLAHRRFSSNSTARLALKQQGLEFHTVNP